MTDPTPTDGRPHDEAEALLPWYSTGQLDPRERARDEHHLASCAHCQCQWEVELRLIDEVQALTPDVDSGWARLRARIESSSPTRRERPGVVPALGDFWTMLKRPAFAAVAVAQLAFLVVAG